MLRLLLWTCGNGCPGSMARGVRTGAMLARNSVSTCRRSASVRSSSRTRSTPPAARDRKSTRLNSSHGYISYAVFCLKKKKESGWDERNEDMAKSEVAGLQQGTAHSLA